MKREARWNIAAPEWDQARAQAVLDLLPDDWDAVLATPAITCEHADSEDDCIGEYVGPGWTIYQGDRFVMVITPFEKMEDDDWRTRYLDGVRDLFQRHEAEEEAARG